MAGQNPNSPTEFQYFFEDEVFKINSRGQVVFGLVLENFEANSSDQDSDIDVPIQKGEIRVVWHPSGIERVMSEKSVGLADRSLMPGDVVRRMIKGKDTQRGYCRDIIVSAAVQVVGTNLVLPSVISQRLQPIEEFTADLAVCLDSWVGTTKIVHSKMRLASADGSRLEYPDVSTCPLEDCLTRRRRGGRGLSGHAVAPEYFPGQYVAGPLGALDHANWLNTTKDMKAARKHKMREHKFTVEAVETESVGVQWQCRALGESSDSGPPQQPRFLVEGEDLKRLRLLNLFEPCTIQVGARNFLNLTPEDNFCTKSQWKKNQGKSYRALRRLTRPPRNKDTKEINSKDPSGNNAQSQDVNATGKHTYRLAAKSKKRLSIHSRDCKIVCAHNAQPLPSLETKQHICKDATGDDKICPSKMDIDIVIVDSESIAKEGLNKFDSAESNTSKADCKVNKNHPEKCNEASGSPQKTADSGPRLAVPDSAWNGKSSPSDPSCSPEYADPSEKHKKLRKSRLCNSIHSGNDNLALMNGDHKSADEHHAELDDSDNWDNTSTDDVTDTDSCATWSSHCSSSNNSLASGRGKKSPQLVTKFLKGKRLKRSAKKDPAVPHPKPGDKLVVEILCTTSKANVVWQDGTIELGIPSTDLFPIHHLDGQECFPGDFVVGGSGIGELAPSHRDYGVVQRVDHHGRTAVVKWFRTYTSCQEPVPKMITESEVSVYDLKDHPDFQYRPGTVVIRVANFTGTEASCTAGQVIDNFPSGRVHVWWVDGHSSMCWPQDLFKVGEYDSDEGDFWADDGTASDDSWETQSSGGSGVDKTERIISYSTRNIEIFGSLEGNFDLLVDGALPSLDTVPANPPAGVGEFPKVPRSLEPRAAAHIERGRAAMAKLEEMFSQNPALQNQEIMRKLLNLYKDCRFLDKLMGTSFFHEDHFQGLLERVRERGGSSRESGVAVGSGTRKVQNQVMRLFSRDDGAIDLSKTMLTNIKDTEAARDLNPTNTLNGQKESSPKLEITKKSDLDVSPIPQVEISNLSLIGDQFSNVLYSIEGVKCENKDDSMDASLICNSYPPNHNSSMVDAKSPNRHLSMEIDSEKLSNVSITSPSHLKEPTVDVLRPLSSSSDGSISKYATPAGSLGDLALQLSHEEKSPSNIGKIIGNEDSGMESQSVSISQSVNNTVSSNGEYECSFQSTEFPLQDCAAPPGALKAPRTAHMSSSPDTQLSTRNVCLKLCSLINIQMMKACAEVSRRRCLVLADFLNKVMSVENTSGTPLPYRFSVQYDALVVNMTDSKNEPGKENVEENKMETSETASVIVEAVVNNEKTSDVGILQSEEIKECDSHSGTPGPSKNVTELGEGFIVMESAPSCHRFRLSLLQPSEPRIFHQAVRREIKLLNSDLPPGVWVRGYEDRMDLLSIMIGGPAKTPYEDGLFLFDVQLGGEYPRAPPLCYYISYCSDRLNPNLYEDGKVCVSLLGTWSGHGVELWGRDSSLLQVIVSLQGLILCAEPYFNEAGYDKQKGSQQGNENSRMYNEMVLLKLVQSLTKLIGNPPEVFCKEILSHQKNHAAGLCDRLERWMLMSEEHNRTHPESPLTPDSFRGVSEESDIRPPEYPLIPASRGFCLTLRSSLESYRNALKRANIAFEKEL